jgi:hypothetical protein
VESSPRKRRNANVSHEEEMESGPSPRKRKPAAVGANVQRRGGRNLFGSVDDGMCISIIFGASLFVHYSRFDFSDTIRCGSDGGGRTQFVRTSRRWYVHLIVLGYLCIISHM